MRIGVSDLFNPEKGTAGLKQLHDGFIGLKDVETLKVLSAYELSPTVYGAVDIESIRLSNEVVLMAVSGGRMNATGSLFQSYMIP
jgi:hypothetical protein